MAGQSLRLWLERGGRGWGGGAQGQVPPGGETETMEPGLMGPRKGGWMFSIAAGRREDVRELLPADFTAGFYGDQR